MVNLLHLFGFGEEEGTIDKTERKRLFE